MKNIKHTLGRMFECGLTSFTLSVLIMLSCINNVNAGVGELLGYGNNYWAQLARPGSMNIIDPQLVDRGVVAVAAGENHALYLTHDGYLYAMGRNHVGQLGDGTFVDRVSPVFVAKNVTKISAQGNCSVFVTADGQLFGMGSNKYKQLGDPQNDPFTYSSSDFTYHGQLHQYMICDPVLIAEKVIDAKIGKMHTLYLTDSDELWAVGRNESGEFGMGRPTIGPLNQTMVAERVKAIAAGDSASYYIDHSGDLWAAGYNEYGQLGLEMQNGSSVTSYHFVAHNVKDISAGKYFAAFVTHKGELLGMGINEQGQLSPEAFQDTLNMPVAFLDKDVDRVSCGETHLIYSRSNGELWGLGSAAGGKLGFYSQDHHVKIQINHIDGIKDIAAGGTQTLFIHGDHLYTIGSNDYGQQGIGKYSQIEKPVHLASEVSVFDAGACFNLFINDNSELWGIGRNDEYQMGSEVPRENDAPVKLIPNRMYPDMKVKHVSTGHSYTLFLTSENELYGMGSNRYGQLGLGHTTHVTTPKLISEKVEGMAAHGKHCMFWTTDGTLFAMGHNADGQLGDGSTTDRHLPVKIAEKVKKAAVAYDHSMFLTRDNELYAMGNNSNFQLMREGGSSSNPVFITDKVADIAAGNRRTLFLDTTGALWMGGRRAPYLVHEHVVSMDCYSAATYYVTEDGQLFSSYGDEVIAEDVAQVKVTSNHVIFTCNKDYKSKELLNVRTTVVTQNSWPLDPEGVLADDATFQVEGRLPDGLRIEGKHLDGVIGESGVYSFRVTGKDSRDVVTTDFYITVLKRQKYPIFLGANVNGRFIPSEGSHGESLQVTIDSTQTNSIQLITDASPHDVYFTSIEDAPFKMTYGLDAFIRSFLSFNEYTGRITGICEIWDYTTQLGEVDSKIFFKDSRGEAAVNLIITVE